MEENNPQLQAAWPGYGHCFCWWPYNQDIFG